MKEPKKEKNPAAVALGRRAAGKPKQLTDEQRAAMAERMRLVSKAHHAKQKAKKDEEDAKAKASVLRRFESQIPGFIDRDWEDDSKQYQPV